MLLKALFNHAFLLLTFRHDGRGLPRQWPGFLLILAIYFAGTLLTWHLTESAAPLPSLLLGMALTIFIWTALINRQMTSGFMLISVVTCILAALIPVIPGIIWMIWGFLTLLLMFLRWTKQQKSSNT